MCVCVYVLYNAFMFETVNTTLCTYFFHLKCLSLIDFVKIRKSNILTT